MQEYVEKIEGKKKKKSVRNPWFQPKITQSYSSIKCHTFLGDTLLLTVSVNILEMALLSVLS